MSALQRSGDVRPGAGCRITLFGEIEFLTNNAREASHDS